MKKNYLEPTEKVVELDLDSNLLQNSDLEDGELEGGSTGMGGDGKPGQDGDVKRESLWEDLW